MVAALVHSGVIPRNEIGFSRRQPQNAIQKLGASWGPWGAGSTSEPRHYGGGRLTRWLRVSKHAASGYGKRWADKPPGLATCIANSCQVGHSRSLLAAKQTERDFSRSKAFGWGPLRVQRRIEGRGHIDRSGILALAGTKVGKRLLPILGWTSSYDLR